MNGTQGLETERLVLRRHEVADGKVLHRLFGTNEKMYEYSGWNPYETLEKAQGTIGFFMSSYDDETFYGWAVTRDGELVGTAGAYDYDQEASKVEVGISIREDCWGQGYASEALECLLAYLTGSEGISTVTAWCAADNIGSMKAMEKAGMIRVGEEAGGLEVGEKRYDKLYYEYRE